MQNDENSSSRCDSPLVDITQLMNRYRECVRHLWNEYFWTDAETDKDWDLGDEYDQVAVELFSSLVLRKIGRDDVNLALYRVVPRNPLLFLRVEVDSRSQVMINREIDSGYWDHPLNFVEKDELDLRFISFFDWDDLGFRNFELYLARIHASDKHPELVGRNALLPAGQGIKVLHDEAFEETGTAN